MARGRRGARGAARRGAGPWAVALAALLVASGARAAEECAPLGKRACRKSATCRWAGGAGACAVATDACDAVQGGRLRKKCAAVSSMRCECSLSPEKKRGKCGVCVESLVGGAWPPPAPPAGGRGPPCEACKTRQKCKREEVLPPGAPCDRPGHNHGKPKCCFMYGTSGPYECARSRCRRGKCGKCARVFSSPAGGGS